MHCGCSADYNGRTGYDTRNARRSRKRPICDRRDRRTHRLARGLAGLGLGFMQKPRDLLEGFIDQVEVRGIVRRVQQVASSFLDQLLDPLTW